MPSNLHTGIPHNVSLSYSILAGIDTGFCLGRGGGGGGGENCMDDMYAECQICVF